MTNPLGPIDELLEAAHMLAGAFGARARASTSFGQERATLRLFGVTGLAGDGRPLTVATVDRWLAADRRGLGGGIALPFAMGLLEYDLDPQQLALDVASGAVDLGLEADLLREPDRRTAAEAEATRLAAVALGRIDSDRIARREIVDLLGDVPRPWAGTTLTEPDLEGGLAEVTALVGAGVDVVRIEVPVGRELADRLHAAGADVREWRPRSASDARPRRPDVEVAPAGSQRALTELRRLTDRLAAGRRGYVRMATAAPALWTPEDAVVAAFEQIDLVEGDPMADIVATGVDPDRVLSDRAFAHRIQRRAGTMLSIGAGSLVVAPDVRTGVPSDPVTRCGRALGLQVLAVALAVADGLAADQVAVAGLPPWIIDEPTAGARSLAEIAVRREVFAGHPMSFSEPEGTPEHLATWPYLLAAGLTLAGDVAVVMRRPGRPATVARETHAAARVAGEMSGAFAGGGLAGIGADHARGIVTVARDTLRLLADRGWSAIVGDGPAVRAGVSMGRDALADRVESFDPFAALGSS